MTYPWHTVALCRFLDLNMQSVVVHVVGRLSSLFATRLSFLGGIRHGRLLEKRAFAHLLH